MSVDFVVPLTFDILKREGYIDEEEWADLFGIDVFCYQNSEELGDSDFIFGEIQVEETKYKFIHGFPGDNPSGLFYKSDNNDYEERILVGEGMNSSDHPAIKWYNETTQNGCKFLESFWYVNSGDE